LNRRGKNLPYNSECDISQFPNIKILVEASNKFGEPLDTLEPKNVFIYENGIQRNYSIEKVKTPEKIAFDFIFIVIKQALCSNILME
jgi:hypothetical protein